MKNQNKRYFLLAILVYISLFCLASCSTQYASITQVLSTYTPIPESETNTLTPSKTTVKSSLTPRPSLTPTLAKTSTKTVTPIPTSTKTKLPKITKDDIEEFILELYQSNFDCTLPCWWGIVPGETQWLDASVFLKQFSRVTTQQSPLNESIQVGFAQIPVPEKIFNLPLLTNAYLVRNGIVEQMYIPLGNAPTQLLSNFLQKYGKPEEIWISTYSTEYPAGILPFVVYLFYPNQGILATFGPMSTTFANDYIVGCKMDTTASSYRLWFTQMKTKTFKDVGEMFEMKLNEPGIQVLPIENVTTMDVFTFYDTYKQPGIEFCIETPREIWPAQQ